MKKLKLRNYIETLKDKGLLVSSSCSEGVLDAEIDCLTYDTRALGLSALFVCKGVHFRKDYLDFALANGAIAYVSEVKYAERNEILVSSVRQAMVILALLFFDNSPAKLISVGITGTKGKSTTAYYLRSVLNDYLRASDKPECAILSSIDNYDGVIKEESHLTTPEAIELHRHFNNAYTSGITHLVMEVSSQALKYDRVKGINYDIACFTNIGTDHISPAEHSDFEDYFSSKLKIFDSCKVACINTDAEHSERALEYAKGKCRVITFGSHESDTVYCKNVSKRGEAIYFTVKTPDYEKEMCITMPGLFNVENALATVAMAYALNIPEGYVASGLEKARAGGRMQSYCSRDGKITVIVDYAHNRMSFEALYNSVKVEYPGKDIITVFGCPGCKAFLRRRDLGELAGKNSDYVVVTEEDSGDESFDSISSDIVKNLGECKHSVIENRGEAIKDAILTYPAENKLVLITGKGEETRQKRGTEYIECPSDVEYTLEFLRQYDASVLTVI